jgi:hypothetical protein
MTFAQRQRRLRARSEYVLRLAAMDRVGRRHPGKLARSALPDGGPLWRYVFVPLYRRVPWDFRRRAMRSLRMTAQGWPEDARQFGEPWRPPAAKAPPESAGPESAGPESAAPAGPASPAGSDRP